MPISTRLTAPTPAEPTHTGVVHLLGVVKDPPTLRITCDFCRTATVRLAGDIDFTIE